MIEPFMEKRVATAIRSQGQAILAAVTAAEVFTSAPQAQAHGFYVAVGRRLAGHIDLALVFDTDMLVARINRFWGAMEWGEAALELGEDAIFIRHSGLPEGMDGDVDGCWPRMATAILEGAYDAWFRALGSDERLSTKLVEWRDGVVRLRHGG
jgi:hypothetical protein